MGSATCFPAFVVSRPWLRRTVSEVLQPLVERILQLVRESHLVLADETPMRVQAEGKTRRGYL
jgi:Transposase IS66 family